MRDDVQSVAQDRGSSSSGPVTFLRRVPLPQASVACLDCVCAVVSQRVSPRRRIPIGRHGLPHLLALGLGLCARSVWQKNGNSGDNSSSKQVSGHVKYFLSLHSRQAVPCRYTGTIPKAASDFKLRAWYDLFSLFI
jgi:hypothetical protein